MGDRKTYLESLPLWIYLSIIGVVSLILLLLCFNAQPSLLDDNFHYLNLGKALYMGEGFVQLDTPGHPVENQVAPGYPAFLALIMKIAGNPHAIVPLKLFSTLCYWLSIIIAVFIFINYMGVKRSLAALFALFMAVNTSINMFASMITTEAPFILFSTSTVLFLLAYNETGKVIHFFLGAFFTIIALYIRIPGGALAVAGFLWLLSRRDYKKAFIYAAIVGIGLAIWVAPLVLTGKWAYLGQVSSVESAADRYGIVYTSFVGRILHHILAYAFNYIPRLFFPSLKNALYVNPQERIFSTTGLVLGLLMFTGYVLAFIGNYRDKSRRLPLIYIACYFGVASLTSSHGLRYTTYLFIWLTVSYIFGVDSILKKLKAKKLASYIPHLLVAAVILINLPPYFKDAVSTARTRTLHHSEKERLSPTVELGKYENEPQMIRMHEASEWCSTNVPEDAVILATQWRSVYFFSDRQTLNAREWFVEMMSREADGSLGFDDDLVDSLWIWALSNGVTHVLVDPVYKISQVYLGPALKKYPNCCRIIGSTSEPATYVYYVDTLCLRNSLGFGPMKIIERLIGVHRLSESGDRDSLLAFLEDYKRSEEDVEEICASIRYAMGVHKYNEAQFACHAATIIYPKNPDIWFNWGVELNKVKSYDVALHALEEALALGADSSDCYNNMGVAFLGMNSLDKGDSLFALAIELDPNDIQKINNRVASLINSGNVFKAEALLEEILATEDADSSFITQIRVLKKRLDKWKRNN